MLPRERPQLGECQQQRPGTHRPQARDTLPEVVVYSPQRTGPEQRLHVVVQRRQARLAPGHMSLDGLGQAPARSREAVLFRRVHADPWLVAAQEGAQLRRLGVGPWPGHRAAHIGTVGQGAGIQGSRLGQRPRGTRTIARLAWGHNDDGQARCGPGRRWLPTQLGWGGGSAPVPRASRRHQARSARPSALRRDVRH